MRFSWSSLARLVLGGVFLSSATAIGLARLAPASVGWRMTSQASHVNVNTFVFSPCKRGSIWLDRDRGSTLEVPSPQGDLIEYASCSPWCDERGRRQLVGRWSWSFGAGDPEASLGLVRLSFPEGEVLDHIETTVVPISVPCWYPGTQARVLFAAGDGRLYQHDFEPAGDLAGTGVENRPRPLIWGCPIPGGGGVFLAEPFWLDDPRWHDVVLVGLRTTTAAGQPKQSSGPTQVWWLRLSEDGGTIIEAGRLLAESPLGAEYIERYPTLGRTSDGRLRLAYLRRFPPGPLELWVTDLDVDTERRCPKAIRGEGVRLATDCLASLPIFSSDGRSIRVLVSEGGAPRVRPIRLDGGPAQ
jgi:hypothetical protein